MTPAEHRATLMQYLRSCFDRRDWHGVSDAANDLRELEAAHPETRDDGPAAL
jgi:hypothetical protein